MRIAFHLLVTIPAVTILGSHAAATRDNGQAGAAPKYTYVLVHGAWAGGWEWKKVGQRLLDAGHTVYRPTHTGQGERRHLASPDVTLDTHVTDVVNVILFEDLRDIVLMGHSYGGIVISGVADRVPERVKCLVYVDAFVPEDGESLNAMTGGRGRTVVDGFVGNAPKPDQQPPYIVPQSARTFSDPVSLKNPAAAKIPAAYILTVDKGRKPEEDGFYKSYQRAQARGWHTEIMEGGHVVNQTHPGELAALLQAAPGKAKPRSRASITGRRPAPRSGSAIPGSRRSSRGTARPSRAP